MAMTGIEYATAAKEQRQTFMSEIEAAHERVSQMASRMDELANRLCGGSAPTDISQGVRPAAVPNGIFDAVTERAQDMSAKLEAIRDNINRIERSLP
jgi:transcription elongation factor Elf1